MSWDVRYLIMKYVTPPHLVARLTHIFTNVDQHCCCYEVVYVHAMKAYREI
jgi:hypothetical protein